MELKKTIAEFRISISEYLLYGFSFWTKHFAIEVLRPNLSKMDILRTKVKKIIVEFKIGSLEYPYASSFILNKTFSSFGTKIVQKSKSPSTLIWVNVKQFTQFWVIVGHSRSI